MSELESSKRTQQMLLLYFSELKKLGGPASSDSGAIVGRKLIELVRHDLEIAWPGCTRDAIKKATCDHGHDIHPDHCDNTPEPCNDPRHDYCYRCGKFASDLGFERDQENPGMYRQVTL